MTQLFPTRLFPTRLAPPPLVLSALLLCATASAQQPCTSVEACEQAIARGEHAVAEQGLERLRSGRTAGPAALALARLYLETGRYAEAERAAAPHARSGPLRDRASVLAGEAHLARGQLDEAEHAFASVTAAPAAHRARVLLGRTLMRRGRDQEAQAPLMAVIGAYNDESIGASDAEGLTYVGMAAALLGSPHDANDAFREANRADASRVETQLEWAQLFLSHYDAGHAEECVQQALRANPNSARAHALQARIELEQSLDFLAAQRELDRALAIDPSLVMAHVARAGIAIRDMDLAAADRHLDAALAVDPNDLEALSVRAALRFLADDPAGYRRATQEVLRRNPRFSEMYTIIGDYAEWEHRYPQLVEMAREALRIDGEDALAHATLGINLLRMGQEQEGLTALREAWRRDSFNVRVYNLLNLFDHVIGPQYESFPAGPFVFRMHREERPVMERYARETLTRAYEDMRRRYGFTPRTPVHVEMFAEEPHFSVRTSGLPNIGVQGVCFGQVLTALSPRGGPFNWAQITWHELAHVFHIQLSENHVPRWFTEGLAEYETMIARPEWQREDDHTLWRALEGGRLPPLSQLTHAFTHARSAEDMMVAYYWSSMVVKYIAERFGFERLPRMLREWARGRTTEQVVQTALGIPIDQLDRELREHTRQRLASRASDFALDLPRYRDLDAIRARAQAAPNDAAAQGELAAALLAHGQAQEALRAASRALTLDPSQPVALYVCVELALARRDTQTATQHAARLIAAGHDGYDVRLLQARAAMARQDPRAAREALEAATRIDGARIEAWQGLSELAGRARDADLRLHALTRIVELDQHDRESHASLLAMLAERDRWDEVLRFGESGIYVDPERAESRRLLAEAYLRANRARDALPEADTALAARPERPGPVHLLRARILHALRRGREAQQAAQEAVRADPSLADQARAIGN